MIALLLAVAAPQTAVDAERAFAADAKTLGQWTAFRKWAADDAVLFWPQPVNAQAQLRTLNDPPRPVEWSPSESYVSCDGTVAANTGPWTRPDGSAGYFSTIWVKQRQGGWKWTVDGGDALETPRPTVKEPAVRVASCERKPRGAIGVAPKDAKSADGQSRDHTLYWSWVVQPDGARMFNVLLWTGERYDRVIADRIAAPPAPPKP